LTANEFASLDIHAVDADILLGKAATQIDESTPDLGESPVVIRRKEFAGNAMTVDDALYHMELVGHDF
jgi:hypothetical protein